jgi:L-alanine-DL-glutamate epimerase-like enolase superfamily enzyme
MKVESVEAFPISMKVEEALRGGTFSYSHYQTVIVRTVVDGVEGWGEAMTRFDPDATAVLVRYLGRSLLGRSYDDVRGAWNQVWKELRIRGHTRGVDVEALSGIEIALHDCLGKLRKVPLSKLYSEEPARDVPAFAGSLFASRGPLEDQVQAAKDAGLAGAKIKIGFGIEEDRRTLSKVRGAWEGGILVADANGAYDSGGAAKACEAFADLDLAWFEEPVLADNVEGYISLMGSKVKIGAGESWFVGDFDWPIIRKFVDVLEPSVSRCGGVGVMMDVAKRAEEKGIGFSPMTGMNSAVSLAASLHAGAARRSVGVEYNPFANPLQTELASGLERPRDGRMRVPSGHGLGIAIDVNFVKTHTK